MSYYVRKKVVRFKIPKNIIEELKKEEAFETIIEKYDGASEVVTITYKYSDSIKRITIENVFTQKFEIKGRFWLQNLDLLYKAINKKIEELQW